MKEKEKELADVAQALTDAEDAHEQKVAMLDKRMQEQAKRIAELQAKYEPQEGVPDPSPKAMAERFRKQ